MVSVSGGRIPDLPGEPGTDDPTDSADGGEPSVWTSRGRVGWLVAGVAVVAVVAVVVLVRAIDGGGDATPVADRARDDVADVPGGTEPPVGPVEDVEDDDEVSVVSWTVEELAVTVEEFASAGVPVTLEVTSAVAGPVWLEVHGDVADRLGPPRWELDDVEAGEVVVELVADARGEPGEVVSGWLVVSDGDEPLSEELPVTVEIVERDPDAARSELLTASSDRLVDVGAGLVVVDELTVFVDGGVEVAAAVADDHQMRLVGSSEAAGIYQFVVDLDLDNDADVDARVDALIDAGEELSGDDRVRHAGPSMAHETSSSASDDEDGPSTPGLDPDWHLVVVDEPGVRDQWGDETPDWELATVAILDADFDVRHTHLSFADITGNARVHGASGHGNQVAGVACAAPNPDENTSGVSQHCDLRAYNVGIGTMSFDERCGENDRPRCFSVRIDNSVAFQQMHNAATDGARVANLSFGPVIDAEACGSIHDGGIGYRLMVEQARAYAEAVTNAHTASPHGSVLWVTSAGNSACGAEMIGQKRLSNPNPVPGLDPNIAANIAATWITVAAMSPTGGLWHQSDDPPTGSNSHPDVITIAAPGHDIRTTDACATLSVAPHGSPPPTTCNKYKWATGTSYAAPIITGIAATMFAANPDLTAEHAKRCIARAAQQPVIDHPFGRANAPAAIACAIDPDPQLLFGCTFDDLVQATPAPDQIDGLPEERLWAPFSEDRNCAPGWAYLTAQFDDLDAEEHYLYQSTDQGWVFANALYSLELTNRLADGTDLSREQFGRYFGFLGWPGHVDSADDVARFITVEPGGEPGTNSRVLTMVAMWLSGESMDAYRDWLVDLGDTVGVQEPCQQGAEGSRFGPSGWSCRFLADSGNVWVVHVDEALAQAEFERSPTDGSAGLGPDATIETVADAWIEAVMSGDEAAALALEVPGRSPSVYSYGRAMYLEEADRDWTSWGPVLLCDPTVGERWRGCAWLRADPAPSLILETGADGILRMSHIVNVIPGDPPPLAVVCGLPDRDVAVHGAPSEEATVFERIPAGTCGFEVSERNWTEEEIPWMGPGWQQVEWAGTVGWVRSEDLVQ